MEEIDNNDQKDEVLLRDKYGLPIFIGISIALAMVLVAISMSIYTSSGAAQLDLSRPGYVSVRSKIKNDTSELKTFSASGTLDAKVIDNFLVTYDKQVLKTKSADAFAGDPLDPVSLYADVVIGG